jgi:hypothetical protein
LTRQARDKRKGISTGRFTQDMAIFSDKRQVLVWRWAAGADPATAPLQQVGAAGEVVGAAGVITTEEVERLLLLRETARANKEFGVADGLKLELQRQGVALDYKALLWRAADGRSGVLAPWGAAQRAAVTVTAS